MNRVLFLYRSIKEKKKKKLLKKLYPSSLVSVNCIINKDTVLKGENKIYEGTYLASSILGNCTYVLPGSSLPGCLIGSFCSISSNVSVVTATHPLSFVSSYPGFYNTSSSIPFGKGNVFFDESTKKIDGYNVIIGNDVWVGRNVLIKGGIIIGDGAVIAMSSVVTKDVPPYAIVGGVPAKVIRYRFDQQTINSLLQIKWWDWPVELIKKRREEFIDVSAFIKKYGVK